ncbi:MAG: prephenate dehydrogenase/arogenate dehydrogenase family protein [Gammaproteobacteria bacterium]|nr:prephenate dehydrogenase/arogenate dehydrogenase family protein [Gammaproteobacteria bacterium]
MFERIAIIGLGLIGGSLARALRAKGLVGEVVGCGRDEHNLQRGIALGVIDRYSTNPAEAVHDADLVVLATTLGATSEVCRRIAPGLAPQALITDVGSTKRSVVEAARAHLGPALSRFVPGHPIAGGEKSGVEASTETLFERHRVILTPVSETASFAVGKVRRMWEATGAEVTLMEVDHHDLVLAATSHLPHLLAFALVDCLASAGSGDGRSTGEIFDYAAGGFRDFTRIASSNPDMWRDIAMANRTALMAVCTRFEATLGALKSAIDREDGAVLHATFTRAKKARDAYLTRRGLT